MTTKPLTWNDVKSWADIPTDEEKHIMRDVLARTLKEKICPHLRTIVEGEGVQWTYCGKLAGTFVRPNDLQNQDIPSWRDPKYIAHVDCAELQLFCADRFTRCIHYPPRIPSDKT